jgi:hypothetical protein
MVASKPVTDRFGRRSSRSAPRLRKPKMVCETWDGSSAQAPQTNMDLTDISRTLTERGVPGPSGADTDAHEGGAGEPLTVLRKPHRRRTTCIPATCPTAGSVR